MCWQIIVCLFCFCEMKMTPHNTVTGKNWCFGTTMTKSFSAKESFELQVTMFMLGFCSTCCDNFPMHLLCSFLQIWQCAKHTCLAMHHCKSHDRFGPTFGGMMKWMVTIHQWTIIFFHFVSFHVIFILILFWFLTCFFIFECHCSVNFFMSFFTCF